MLVVVGIRFGVVTTTEAAALAALYALLLGVFARLRTASLYEATRQAAVEASAIGLLIGSAAPFAFLLAVDDISGLVSSIATSLGARYVLHIFDGMQFLVLIPERPVVSGEIEAGGGFAMGLGVWSMHFVGMLAFHLPIPLGYDIGLTVCSMLAAVASSAFALWVGSRSQLPLLRLVLGAALMGAGIVLMHYIGMAALQMQPGIQYHLGWFTLSVVVAVAASGAALWISFHLRREGRRKYFLRALAAVVMGLAIVGMHYMGMAAAQFPGRAQPWALLMSPMRPEADGRHVLEAVIHRDRVAVA